MKQGRTPSLEEIAQEALVSRATAYRYFKSAEAILVEASVDLAMPTADAIFAGAPSDPAARLERVDTALHDMSLANEAQLRLMLVHTLQQGGRRRRAAAAEPAHAPDRRGAAPARGAFKPAALANLRRALAYLIGTEGMIVANDVLRIDGRRGAQGQALGDTSAGRGGEGLTQRRLQGLRAAAYHGHSRNRQHPEGNGRHGFRTQRRAPHAQGSRASLRRGRIDAAGGRRAGARGRGPGSWDRGEGAGADRQGVEGARAVGPGRAGRRRRRRPAGGGDDRGQRGIGALHHALHPAAGLAEPAHDDGDGERAPSARRICAPYVRGETISAIGISEPGAGARSRRDDHARGCATATTGSSTGARSGSPAPRKPTSPS
ncbi:MAG: TetR/AcrR family transcriptional regulator [Rhizomicrobium sp.]